MVGAAATAFAGEPPKPAAPEPPRIVAPTAEEIKAELDKETPAQKALRAELEALAKAGQKIYFNANLGEANRSEIFVAGPDGSNVKQLTDKEGSYPHCSSDGKKVVFVSWRVPFKIPLPPELKDIPADPKYPLDEGKDYAWRRGQCGVIWTMNSDGSDQKPVAVGGLPHFSHDGRFICYNVINPPFPAQLVIMDLEKKTEAGIVHPGLRNSGMPCFSPDDQYVIGSNGPAYCVKLNAGKNGLESVFMFDNGHPCNGDLSPDGRTWVYVRDTDGCLGGWLRVRPMDYEKPGGAETNLPLQHAPGSVNYFPDFSPDGKYLVYSHAEQEKDIKSWEVKNKMELYVTRFPKCEATVRITWNGAANQHPQWWGPPAGK
jgi:Tol biopolymer transport system component